MDKYFWNELIDEVENQVGHHLDSLMIIKWARIAVSKNMMDARNYFIFKQKLGMGY